MMIPRYLVVVTHCNGELGSTNALAPGSIGKRTDLLQLVWRPERATKRSNIRDTSESELLWSRRKRIRSSE